jgi:outer membrane protein OmpA-like peptidoglycan-associated protein
MLVDFSRGADGVIARSGINGIEDLRGKTIAYPEFTPSHFLLWYGLKSNRSTLSRQAMAEIRGRAVKAASGVESAQVFAQRKEVDAAVTWDPDMAIALKQRPGSHTIYTTKDASRQIADILVARDDFAARNPAALRRFAEAWYDGVKGLRSEPARAYGVLGTIPQFGMDGETARSMLDGVDLSTQAQNAGFFGVTPGGQVSDYERIFREAQEMYVEERQIRDKTGDLEQTLNREILALPKIGVREPIPQPRSPCDTHGPSYSRQVFKVWFDTGKSEMGYEDLAQVNRFAQGNAGFQNAIIRVEGYTDSTGSAAINERLSRERADAVKAELVRLGFDEGSLCTVGYGPANPVGDNGTKVGRQENRRTEIKLYHRDNR